jgi:hypothetical protein
MLISLLANSWRVFLFLLSITDVRSLDKIERKGLYVLSGTGLAWKGCTSLKSSKVFLVPGRVTGGLVASWTDEFHLGCGWILNWFRVVSAFGIAGVIAGVERNPWYLKLLIFFGDRSEEKHRHPAQHLVEDLGFISFFGNFLLSSMSQKLCWFIQGRSPFYSLLRSLPPWPSLQFVVFLYNFLSRMSQIVEMYAYHN